MKNRLIIPLLILYTIVEIICVIQINNYKLKNEELQKRIYELQNEISVLSDEYNQYKENYNFINDSKNVIKQK